MNKQFLNLLTIGLTLLLTACGGSGGGDKSPTPQLTEKSPLGTQNTLTPEYTFTSTLAGTINFLGTCTSNTEQAIAGDNTISFNELEWWGEYENCEITVTSDTGKVSPLLKITAFTVQPRLNEISDLGVVNTQTPEYTFYTDMAGEIKYIGNCSSSVTQAKVGENTIKFNELEWWGEYEDCEITVTSDTGKVSPLLKITIFEIIPKPAEVKEVGEVSTLTPVYTFKTDFAGTIEYEGNCSSETKQATVGENIITFNELKWWITYDDCKLWITTAEGKATDKLSITPFRTVYPAKTPLNDTGMDFCANMPRQAEGFSAELNCADFGVTQTESNWDNGGFVIPAGQDATHGRDALAVQGKLEKIGDGHAGFDFTKLDEDGNELPYSAEQYACVRDNHTNLIWEVKQDTPVKDDLHSGKAGFLWYNSSTNGDFTGMPDAGEPIRDIKCKNTGRCDTEKFIQDVNEEGYCGLNHWRLPTYAEALSIASISSGSNIQESIIYQKNEILENVNRSYLHTSDFIVHDNQRYSVFMYNSLAFLPKTDSRPTFPGSAVLVHNGPEYAEPYSLTDKFEKLTEATALDKNTGLIWTRCPASMNDGNISGNICNKTYYWDEALAAANFANEKQFLDYSDWRLPSGTELASLFEFDHAPFINQDIFPISNLELETKTFWTSTPSPAKLMGEGIYSLRFNYYDGLRFPDKSDKKNYMLLVRGGY